MAEYLVNIEQDQLQFAANAERLIKIRLVSALEFRSWITNEREKTLLYMRLCGQFHRGTNKLKDQESSSG